jgi:hypothetical protein
LGNAGELLAVGNGGTAVFLSNSGGRAPFLPLPSNLAHPFRNQRLEMEDTPSRIFLLKSPSVLGKSSCGPRPIQNMDFLLFILIHLNFIVFIEMSFHCLAYKIVILAQI